MQKYYDLLMKRTMQTLWKHNIAWNLQYCILAQHGHGGSNNWIVVAHG